LFALPTYLIGLNSEKFTPFQKFFADYFFRFQNARNVYLLNNPGIGVRPVLHQRKKADPDRVCLSLSKEAPAKQWSYWGGGL